MADGKRVDSLMDQVWKFFTSIKLAIFIIIILAIASIIGTIIEQNQPLEKYRQIYTDGAIRLFESLNLFDMYHSWWFLLLLVLFTVNLSCCTIDRLPRAVKVVRNPKTTPDANLGNVFGFKGFANIVEGESVRTIPTRGGTNHVDLGFAVRCNKFWVDFYPSGQPKEYASDLSVLENGREVLRKKIVVNDPLQYKGIWFYQSSYGAAGAASATLAVHTPDGGKGETVSLAAGQKKEIPGYGTVSGVDYQNDFQGLGPALLVVLEKPGKPPAQFWLLRAYPNFDRQRGDSRYLSFAGVDQIFYTGLQVAQDPGVNIVWVGCTLMVIGIMIAFFMSHQRLWIRLSRGGDGRVEVVLAGSTNKNRLAFEKRFEKIQADMKAVGA